ncbi:hypothetical protein UFOVP545_2 [uncultured Caudovirales phage]|uniref:Uncharacterized protein n=1 Tax=uncultured Caudovirales phage TaxID=2100421 RepID=A0A6J5MWI0_9CAUD|nr:hypothetical protein UFOVP545_2 [uncultured Caudovirales phage]
MLNVMRVTIGISLTIFGTFAGLSVGEPALGLFALFASIMFLKADWSR